MRPGVSPSKKDTESVTFLDRTGLTNIDIYVYQQKRGEKMCLLYEIYKTTTKFLTYL